MHEAGTLDAVVVGAGLSGLVAAHRLVAHGLTVQVLEAAPRAGGVIRSVSQEGFLYERAANTALDNQATTGALLAELGLQEQRIEVSPQAARRYIVRNGRTVAMPTSPGELLTTRALSVAGKLRVLREPFIPARRDGIEESIAAFVTRRLGPEVLDYLADPFVSGIHAGDPSRLSAQAALPRLVAIEHAHGSLLRGQGAMARARKAGRPAGERGPTFHSFSFRGGMQALTDALASRVPIACGTAVRSLCRLHDGRYRVDVEVDRERRAFHARAVLLAVPAHAAVPLVTDVAPDAVAPLAAIEYAPVAVVVSAYRRDDIAHPLDGFGMLVPHVERRELLGTLFSSTLFAGRAPEGVVLLTSFIGGATAPALVDRDDVALRQLAAREHADLLGARNPLWQDLWRHRQAIPQYTLGHATRIASIQRATAAGRVRLAGNWHGGVSVGDCIANAGALGRELAGLLQGSS